MSKGYKEITVVGNAFPNTLCSKTCSLHSKLYVHNEWVAVMWDILDTIQINVDICKQGKVLAPNNDMLSTIRELSSVKKCSDLTEQWPYLS